MDVGCAGQGIGTGGRQDFDCYRDQGNAGGRAGLDERYRRGDDGSEVSGDVFLSVGKIEDGDHEVELVTEAFLELGKIGRGVGGDDADDVALLECELGLVLLGDGLDFPVFGKAAHHEPVDASVAGGADDAAHQFIANAAVLPWPLYGKSGFGFGSPVVMQAPQFRDGANLAVFYICVDDAAHVRESAGIVGNELVRDGVCEAHAPVGRVQAKQVITELGALCGPQLPDGSSPVRIMRHDRVLRTGSSLLGAFDLSVRLSDEFVHYIASVAWRAGSEQLIRKLRCILVETG